MPPHLRDTIGSAEQALIGAALRGAACRHPEEAEQLLRIADRIDARHKDDSMSQLGKNIREALKQLAESRHRQTAISLSLELANERIRELTAAGPDEEDRAAEAELAAAVAGAAREATGSGGGFEPGPAPLPDDGAEPGPVPVEGEANDRPDPVGGGNLIDQL